MTTSRDQKPATSADTPAGQRLDKWLWFARVVKTRTLASRLVSGGKVRVNRVATDKPSQVVRPEDVLTINVNRRIRILQVVDAGTRRGPAEEAKALYEDLTPPDEAPAPAKGLVTPAPVGQRTPGEGRPTKRERRETDQLRGRDT